MIGGFAAEGHDFRVTRKYPQGLPGNYSQTPPLRVRAHAVLPERRVQAVARRRRQGPGLPGQRRRRRAPSAPSIPGLFSASGVADHPYSGNRSPVNASGLANDVRDVPAAGQPRVRAGPGPARLRLGQALLDLQRRVRLHHQSAARRRLRLAGDRGRLPELERVPELEEPAGGQLRPVPAAGSAARATASASPAGWSSSAASRRRRTSPTGCRCTCPGRPSRPARSAEVWGNARPASFMNLDSGTGPDRRDPTAGRRPRAVPDGADGPARRLGHLLRHARRVLQRRQRAARLHLPGRRPVPADAALPGRRSSPGW